MDSLTEISSELIRTTLHEVVEKRLKTKDFDIDVNAGSKAGENFIGVVYWPKSDPEKKSKLILKIAPESPARRERFVSRPSFLREMFLYGTVLPAFREFEESKGIIHGEHGFHEYPECYKYIDVAPYESILMEDLKETNFAMVEHKIEPITEHHVNIVLRDIGKFHAISLAMKDQQPEKFKALTADFFEVLFQKDDKNMQDLFNSYPAGVIAAITDPADAHLKQKVEKLYERQQVEIGAECVDSKSAEPYSVICHGDLWVNNVMFKNNNDGKPIELRFLDYQMSRYSSPVCDIVYYIYCCTNKALRDKFYDNFLKTYHDSLSAHLKKLGSDADKLFPYSALLDQMHKYAKFGLVMASIFLPLIAAEDGSINIEEVAQGVQGGQQLNTEAFVSGDLKKKVDKRIRDVVADMVKYDYI